MNSSKSLKIIPLGGNGQVNKNMFIYEYGEHQIAVDCGIGFPTESMLGVDVLIPDISYIEKSNKKLHGIVLTHGHQDHMGGLPYVLPRLEKDLPIYGSQLTIALAKNNVQEYGLHNPFKLIKNKIQLGPFSITPIHVTHSIPDCKHFLIETPAGTVYHGTDFKFDLTPPDGKPPDLNKIAQVGSAGIDLLLSDCLRVEKAGFTQPEKLIKETFQKELRTTKGKFIVTTMSSSVARFGMAIEAAASAGRKIALVGRSVETNLKIAAEEGYVNIPKNMLIDRHKIKNFKDSQVALMIAGSQGQEGSSMQRAAAGEHRNVKLKEGDKVVISSDAIPGNESGVYSLIDTLTRQGVEVIYSDITNQLHVSGHGYRGELKLLARLTKPKYFFPIGGQIRHQYAYKKMVQDLGYSEDKTLLPKDGQEIILKDRQVKLGNTTRLRNIYVDGLGIGDVGKVVLRDRQVMSEEGIVVAIIPVDHSTGQITGDIEIVSRGFVYVKESEDLIDEIKDQVKKALEKHKGQVTDWGFIRNKIQDRLDNFIYQKTERNPLIIPVVVEA